MNAQSKECMGCFLNQFCSPVLRPERIRSNGSISKGTLPSIIREACRHTTCDDGKDAARAAMIRNKRTYSVMDYKGLTSSSIEAAAFGTPDKPTHKEELRIVDTTSGAIYSKQDGNYYPTGQHAKQWY